LNYDVKSIKTLEGIEAIRLRPGMYIGSVEQEGLHHITLEIISNVIDEYLNGHCTECTVKINEFITITDNGRGVPFGKAKDGSETLVNVFTKLHTGAKFDSTGQTGYNSSGGQNGVGSKATNALSEAFNVTSYRDGKKAMAQFKRGKLIKYTESDSKTAWHGTIVQFKPDAEIFKATTEIDYNWIRKTLVELAYLSPGLTFKFQYQDKPEEVISSKNGIKDYMEKLFEKKNPITSMFYAKSNEGQIGIELAMRYNDSFSDTYKLFTNSIPNSSGTHLTGFRTALTQTINEYARDKSLLKDKDNNLTGDELKEGLTLILSFKMPDPVFSGQTKDVLSSAEARTAVQRLVSKELKLWFDMNPKEAKAIVEKALLARAAREKAKKAKDAVRNIEGKKKNKGFLNLPTKLVDCWSKNRAECELFIAEGDSAASGLVGARNAEFQAIFPVRGKIISARKCTSEKLLANQEVVNLIKALGLEFDPKKVKLTYDEHKLRYGKIMLAADADPDGEAIKNLLLTLFWELCPELVINGHIYATVPPLFRITTKKNEYIYLRDSNELEEYKKKHINEKYLINRNKGYEVVWPLTTFLKTMRVA
jgi:DNA gyrase/topoisomerase IV subunit B